MKNAFFKGEHLFRRTFLLYCYYDYRGYRLLLLKIICYCMIQSHNRVKACAHLYTRSCLHWYRNSEHILIQQISSHRYLSCTLSTFLFVTIHEGKYVGSCCSFSTEVVQTWMFIAYAECHYLSFRRCHFFNIFPADRSVFDFVTRGSCGAHLETLWFALNNDCSGKWPA